MPLAGFSDHVNNVCKVGQDAACCRYLAMGGDGMHCMKLDSLRHTLRDTMKSKGDNCPGKPFKELL